MKNSQFLARDETCFAGLPRTPPRPRSRQLPPTPPRTLKPSLPHSGSPARSDCSAGLQSHVTANRGFWLKFDEERDASLDESVSERNSFLSDDEEVNDDFFEFEIDENGNWSSVESQLDSDAEEDALHSDSSPDRSIQISAFESNQAKTDSNETTPSAKDAFRAPPGQPRPEPSKTSTRETPPPVQKVPKAKVSSLKMIKEKGFVNSFKSLNTSIVFDICKSMNLIVG